MTTTRAFMTAAIVFSTLGCAGSPGAPDDESTGTSEEALVTGRGEIQVDLPTTTADLSNWSARTIWYQPGARSRSLPFGQPLSVPAGRTCIALTSSEGVMQTKCGLSVPKNGRLVVKLSYARFTWNPGAMTVNTYGRGTLWPPMALTNNEVALPYEETYTYNWGTGGRPFEFLGPAARTVERLAIPGRFTVEYASPSLPTRSFDVPAGSEVSFDVSPADTSCTFEIDWPTQTLPTASLTYALLGPNWVLSLRELSGWTVETKATAYQLGNYVGADGKARIRFTPKGSSDLFYLLTSGQKQSLQCVPGQVAKAAVRTIEVPADGETERYEILEVNPTTNRVKPLTFYRAGVQETVGGPVGTGVYVLPGKYMVRKLRNVEVLEESVVDLRMP